MINDGFHTYTYDAENRIIQVDGGSAATYSYDAKGQRLRKTASSIGAIDYIRDFSGTVLAEWQSGSVCNCWNRDYVYMGGKLVAEYRDGTTYFRHDDNLGSARVLTMMNQSIHDSMDYQPFGEQTSGDTGTTHKFTGKERDAESAPSGNPMNGLDDFDARYYSSIQGRFMTPDWAARPATVPYAVFGDPQSLNLYGYVRNDPVSMADADGHSVADYMDFDRFHASYYGLQHNDTSPTQGKLKGQNTSQDLSQKGLEFIEGHEGYSDKVYNDVAGNPTIGYGHLIKDGEDFSKGITKEQAEELLAQDTKSAVDSVNSKVTGKLSQVQFDAVVDFTYNLGGKALGKSTLLKNINGGKEVTKENFTDWNHAGGKVVKGLTIRRTDEFNLFSKGNYGGP